MDSIFCLEMIGTVVFAIQGSRVAIEEKLDVLGILILGLSTAVGGGLIRDVILGNTPPAMFINPIYCIVATLTVGGVILTYKYGYHLVKRTSYPHLVKVMNFLDAIGLGVFTVVGANISIQSGYGKNIFLCCFVGVMTGVGGGVLRDVLANRTPIILKKEIYAVASIIGAIVYMNISLYVTEPIAVYSSIAVIIMIRMVALYKKIHLPSLEKTNHSIEG